MKIAGLLPTKALVCLLFATFVFSILPDRPVRAQDSSSDQGLLLEMARAGLEAGQYKQVVRLCESILQKDSVNKEANFLLGIAQHYLGEHDLAVERLQWVLLVDKNNTVAREYLEKSKRKSTSQWSPQEIRLVKTAVQYHEEGLNGLAIGYLKEVLKQNPKNTMALEALGDVYKKLGNPAIAKAAYHKANAEEKAGKIKGEVKYVPKEWWEGLTKKEAQLRDANLKFAEMRERTIATGGRLSEYDKLAYEPLDEAVVEVDVTLTDLKLPLTEAGQQVIKLPKVVRPLSAAERKFREDALHEGRSGMAMELSYRTKEFMEAKSSMESLEEELKNAPLQ